MTRRTGVALGGLILVGALLRIAHWDPGLASDDTNYMNYAAQLVMHDDGRFDATGFVLHMPGPWVFQVKVVNGEMTEVFRVPKTAQ